MNGDFFENLVTIYEKAVTIYTNLVRMYKNLVTIYKNQSKLKTLAYLEIKFYSIKPCRDL